MFIGALVFLGGVVVLVLLGVMSLTQLNVACCFGGEEKIFRC